MANFYEMLLLTIIGFFAMGPVYESTPPAPDVTESVDDKSETSLTLDVTNTDAVSLGDVTCFLQSDGSPCTGETIVVTGLTIVVTNLVQGTGYNFIIVANDGGGSPIAASPLIADACTKPSAPTGLSQSGATTSSVTVGWTGATSPAPDSYNFYIGDIIVDFDITSTTHTNIGALPAPLDATAATGTCKVSAVLTCAFAGTPVESDKAETPCSTAPNVPTLTLTTDSSTAISYTEAANSDDTSASPAVTFTLVRDGATPVTSSPDTGLTPGTSYSYVLTATYEGYNTPAPAKSQCTKPQQALALIEDTTFTKTTSSFKVTWTNPAAAPFPSKYEVILGSHSFTPQIANSGPLEYTFTTTDGSTALTAGTDYVVKIKSVQTGISCTDEISATFCTKPELAVVSPVTSTASSITISWTNPSPAPDKYDVKVGPDVGTLTTVASDILKSGTLSTEITATEFSTIASATTYVCQIISKFSTCTNTQTVSNCNTAPTAPSLSATSMDSSSIMLQYGVDAADTGASPAVNITVTRNLPTSTAVVDEAAVSKTTNYFYDKNLSGQTDYTYTISATYNGASTAGTAITICTAPTAPQNCKVIPLDYDSQRVTCDEPSSGTPTKYTFQKNSDAAVENPAASLTTPSHYFGGLTAASFYMYRVSAVYTCAATGGPVALTTWAAFTPGGYTNPQYPSSVTTTTTDSEIDIQFTNDDASTIGAAKYYMQYWSICDKCAVPFEYDGESRYECIIDNGISKCGSAADPTVLIPCPSDCRSMQECSTTADELCIFPAIMSDMMFYTCTGNDPSNGLTSVSHQGDCSTAVDEDTLESTAQGPCDSNTNCYATEVTNPARMTSMSSGTQYYMRLITLYDYKTSSWTGVFTDCTNPKPPSDFKVDDTVDPTDTTITLKWVEPSGGSSSWDKFKIAETAGTTIASTNTPADEPTSTGITVTGLTAETCYNFELKAIFGCKQLDGSAGTEKESSSVYIDACTAPTKPTVVAIARSSTDIMIQVSGAEDRRYDSYKVQEQAAGSSTWNTVSGADANTLRTGRTAGKSYKYRASVTFNSVESPYSDEVTVCTLPESLSTLTLKTCSASAIAVSWTAATSGTGRTGVSLVIQNEAAVTEDSATEKSFSTGITAASPYTIEATPYLTCTGATTTTVFAASAATLALFNSPEDITVTAEPILGKKVQLKLSAYSASNTYTVKRDSVVIENDLKDQIYLDDDSALAYGTSYAYQVTYVVTDQSDSKCEVTKSVSTCTLPGPVGNLRYTNNDPGDVTVQWDAPSGGVTGYKYKVGTGTATFSDASTTSFTKSDLDAASFYTVQVYATFTCTTPSKTLNGPTESIEIYTTATAPTITAYSYSSTQINVEVSSTEEVDSISLFDETGTPITTGLLKGATYFHTSLTPGTLYQYKAQSVYAGTPGAMSPTAVKQCTQPKEATNLQVSAQTDVSIDVSFTLTAAYTAHEIKYDSQAYAQPTSATAHSFTGLTASSTYTITLKTTAACTPGVAGIPYTAETVLIAYTKPAPPANPKALGISTTEIYVTWDDLTGHTYEIYDKNDPSYKFNAEFGEINLKNLSPGTEYTFVLKVTRQGLSNEVEFSGCTIQLPPTAFTHSTYSDWDTVTLTWTATNDASGGTANNFKITSPGASDVTIPLSETTKDVTLTELSSHTFNLLSERTCSNGDTLSSATSSLTVQGGIENFALTKVARTEDTMVLDVNDKNSETTFTVSSDVQTSGTTIQSDAVPYVFSFASCASEECVKFEGHFGTWDQDSTNEICDCAYPCTVASLAATVNHLKGSVTLTYDDSANPDTVTYEYKDSVTDTWTELPNTNFEIEDIPFADTVYFEVRSVLVCEATGAPVTLISTSATTSAKTGPSAGSITKMEPLDQSGMPHRLQIEFAAASGQDTMDMRFELVCRKRPNTNDGDWGSWYTVEDDMTKFGSPYLYDNLDASTIYHCAIITKLNGLENDTRDFSEAFACTRPEPVTDMRCTGRYGPHNIEYEWKHPFDADDGTYDNNICFAVFYNGASSKVDNGVAHEKRFYSLASSITPYVMGTQAYHLCVVDMETWTPYRKCEDATSADLTALGLTLASEWKVYSDVEEVQCFTSPSVPNIIKAEIIDCELEANVSFEMYSSENGVIYELRRNGALLKTNPYIYYFDKPLQYGKVYFYNIDGYYESTTRDTLVLDVPNDSTPACTCPYAPTPINFDPLTAGSVNITWADYVVSQSGVSSDYFEDGTVARYYQLKYDVIIDGSINIALDENIVTNYMNPDSLLWHLIDGLPGPSHKIDITMRSYLDCKNYQGLLKSIDEQTKTAYTRPNKLSVHDSSGCVSETEIKECLNLEDNVEPENLKFYMENYPNADTLVHTSTNYVNNCTTVSELQPGSRYNFTGTATKYNIEGLPFDYYYMCTCPLPPINFRYEPVSTSEFIIKWDPPAQGGSDNYLYTKTDFPRPIFVNETAQILYFGKFPGTRYTEKATAQTIYKCDRTSGIEDLLSVLTEDTIEACTYPDKPILQHAFVNNTRMKLNWTLEYGSADEYAVTFDPPLVDPTHGPIGSTKDEGYVTTSPEANFDNLTKHGVYIVKVYATFCNLIGEPGHLAIRTAPAAPPLELINLTPPAAAVVFFTIGVFVTAAAYAVLLLVGFWVFTQPPPPPPPPPEPEIPPNWRINRAFEMKADYNLMMFGNGDI